jgi:hypothetical protein
MKIILLALFAGVIAAAP